MDPRPAAHGGARRRARYGAAGFALLVALHSVAALAQGFSELVLRGAESLASRHYEEAARSFRAALEMEPASAPARKGLASASAGLGLSLLRAGRLRESRASLEEAAANRPESAEYHLLLAQVLFRLGDLRAARAEVDRVLELAPDSAPAHELSGDLFTLGGQLNQAVGAWEAAAVAGGSPALAEKIARGRREMAAEEGMSREGSRHFMVLFEREVPPELVQGFLEELDRVFDILHDRLGEYPRDEITVLLYAKDAFRSVTRAPAWSGGLYDGKIRIPVGGLKTVEEAVGLRATLVHEMTHAFLFRMAPVGLPLWFQEGLATTFEGWDPEKIRARFKEHPPERLGSLEDVDRTLRGLGGDVTAGYAAARLAIADLEELRGFAAVRRIIAGVGAGGRFADVFRDEMRLDVAEFEQRWRSGLS